MKKYGLALLALASLFMLTPAGRSVAQSVIQMAYDNTPLGGQLGQKVDSGTHPLPVGVSASSSITSDSGPVVATATPANSSHAAGTSVGGLFTVPIARFNGGSGIVTNFAFTSTGGSVGTYVLRVWQKSPASTTCTDNVAFAGNTTDDNFLITGAPISLTPGAPASTTGDASTYAAIPGLTWDYKNSDTSPSVNLYACIVTVAIDTADDNRLVRAMMSGPQN